MSSKACKSVETQICRNKLYSDEVGISQFNKFRSREKHTSYTRLKFAWNILFCAE